MKTLLSQKTLCYFFIFSLSIFVTAQFSFGNNIYVAPGATGTGTLNDPAGLQSALDMARSNGFDDMLLLQSGNYDASVTTFTYDTTANDNHSVVLSGGWDSYYGSQTMDYSLTTLDGGGLNQVFYLGANKPGLDYHFTLNNLTIQNGYTINKLGAGLLAYTGSTANNDVGNVDLYIAQCNFNHNNATNNMSGGAIYATCYFEIISSSFFSNSAYNGGAIVSTTKPDADQSLSPLIDDSYFEDNSNYGNQGSTIWHNVALHIMNSTIKGRSDGVSSSGNGSSIWGNPGSFTTAHNCLFTKINIQYWGCGIQAFDGGMEAVNCVFEDNQVLFNGYAAITYYHNNGVFDRKIVITNCTFIRNHSFTDYAGALHMRLNGNDSCIVTNCIFSDNGSNPIIKEYSSSYAGVSYSLIQGGFAGYGFEDAGNNLGDVDPLFVSATDLHLTLNSPCVNTGNNNAPATLPYDIEGTIRTLGNTVDMGAYEFNQAPTEITLSTYGVDENNPVGTFVALISAVDPDAGDTHIYELSAGDGSNDADNPSFSISNDSLFEMVSANYEQQPLLHIFLRTLDSGGKDTTRAIILEVVDLNDAPVVSNPIIDQEATVETFFNYTFPANTFFDEDAEDVLAYAASLSGGGALPAWLDFDNVTRTFSGTPPSEETIGIRVTASDLGSLSVSDDFLLVIGEQEGIPELSENNFAVFPNPASGKSLYLESGNTFFNLQVTIYSLEGKLLLRSETNKMLSAIDISRLQSGTYLLVLDADGKLCHTKFAVIR